MTKEEIKSALEAQRSEFESTYFVKLAMKGGIENYVRDCLFDELFKSNKSIETEVSFPKKDDKINRIDILLWKEKETKLVDYIIELGTNGTWQPSGFGSSHARADIERAKQYIPEHFDKFTVTTIINILNVPEELEHWLRKSYKTKILQRIINDNLKSLNDWDTKFSELDKNYIDLVVYAEWKDVKVSVKFYICQYEYASFIKS